MGASAVPQDLDFKLAQEVFIEFARFEYCLKASGFLKNCNGPAKPDWDSFSNCCEIKKLFKEINDETAISCTKMRYLLKYPPKKQIANKGILSWEKAPDISSSQDYFGAVKRVRNNLFHGGKFNGTFFEPDRSKNLLEAVLCILEVARQRHKRIGDAYAEKSD